MDTSLIAKSLSGVLALSLAGCVSVLPEPTAADALYRIDAPEMRQTLAQNLIIREPEAPQIVAGQALVSEDASGAIRLIPSVEWAGRSTRQLQLALVDSFSVDGEGAAILPETGASAGFELSSRVQNFELRGSEAVCAISVALLEGRSRRLVEQGEVLVRQVADSDKVADRAKQMKAAAEQCVAEVSAFAAAALNERTGN